MPSKIGIDVSSAVTVAQFECFAAGTPEGEIEYVYPRIYRSTGSIDFNGKQTMLNAIEAGITDVGGYIFPCLSNSCSSASDQVDAAINAMDGVTTTGPVLLWHDVERHAWPDDKTANRQFITNMIAQANRRGVTQGIYTNKYNWQDIVGLDWTYPADENIPLWYAHYDGEANFNDFEPFGGWNDPSYLIKQYKGDQQSACGVTIDYNFQDDYDPTREITCTSGSLSGVCKADSTCETGVIVSNECPGSATFRCCLSTPCSIPGDIDGICKTTSVCQGTSTSGHCPGAADIQCCTGEPTQAPSAVPSLPPSSSPSSAPTDRSESDEPTQAPSAVPSLPPSSSPSSAPTDRSESDEPTQAPSAVPSLPPSSSPSSAPTDRSESDDVIPEKRTRAPTNVPSNAPSAGPTESPRYPTTAPTKTDRGNISSEPTAAPSIFIVESPLDDPVKFLQQNLASALGCSVMAILGVFWLIKRTRKRRKEFKEYHEKIERKQNDLERKKRASKKDDRRRGRNHSSFDDFSTKRGGRHASEML